MQEGMHGETQEGKAHHVFDKAEAQLRNLLGGAASHQVRILHPDRELDCTCTVIVFLLR